jgi:hypothetical protein
MTLGMFNDGDHADAIQLPHPKLSLRFHLIIESAVRTAWALIKTTSSPRPGFNLSTAGEDDITLELHERLCDHIFDRGIVPGFDREVFAGIEREPKIRNYNYEHPDKMPDLLVRFMDLPEGGMRSQHGLFIECKPVDSDHPAGSTYCDSGLVRFVNGDYAWTMQSAMMMGYAKKGYRLLPKFSEALSGARKKLIATTAEPIACSHTQATSDAEQTVRSEHQRCFTYLEYGSPAPPIVIRHLWLRRDEE